MLTLYNGRPGRGAASDDLAGGVLPPGTVWLDLVSPDAREIAFVQRVTGLAVPDIQELSEIETSSRLRMVDGTFYLSAPLVYRTAEDDPHATPVGFVLSRDYLITVRFAALPAFAGFADDLAHGAAEQSSAEMFAALMDDIVDRVADRLEAVGGDLDALSHRLFTQQMATVAINRRPARQDADLRETLRRVGHAGDLVSKIRDGLLGIGRILPYVAGSKVEWLTPAVIAQCETQRRDIASLSDYDSFLTNKVQLLLDATLGLINIEQNNIIKVLTIVSVVGVPPTLIASMYGMNFKYMPELSWSWGYPYGLALIVLSAILPLVWFKIRGWL